MNTASANSTAEVFDMNCVTFQSLRIFVKIRNQHDTYTAKVTAQVQNISAAFRFITGRKSCQKLWYSKCRWFSACKQKNYTLLLLFDV